MKRFPLLFTLGFLLWVGVSRAHAQTARELLDALPAQIRAEAEAKAKVSPAPNGASFNSNFFISQMNAAKMFLDSGSDDAAFQQLQHAQSTTGVSASLCNACDTIIRKIHQERAEKQAAALAATADMLKHAGAAVVSATSPKDLDATILELSHAANDPNRSKAFENGSDTHVRELLLAAHFVTRWQECLMGAVQVDGRRVSETFRNLLLSDDSLAMQSMDIPRSELLAHIPAQPKPRPTPREEPTPRAASEIDSSLAAVFGKLHTLDDLPTAVRALTALRDETQNYGGGRGYATLANELVTLVPRLHDLEQAYAELQSGLDRAPETWWASQYGNLSGQSAEDLLVPLRVQLLTLALPRLLGAPDKEKPAPGERVDTFLDRLIELARKRSDWPTVARGVEYRRLLLNPRLPYDGSGQSGNGRDDATAFKQFLAGQNFEQAAQYEQAVAAYLSALGTGTQEIPVPLIGERLAAIKKAHPKEYEGGERAGTSVDESADGNFVRTYRRRMQSHMDDTVGVSTASAASSAPPAKVPSLTPSASPSSSPSPTPAASVTPSASP